MGSNKLKCICFSLLVFFSTPAVKAQTWAEWFSQKKTQQKYLIEQLAALKLYSDYLKKGYNIGKTGLNFIKSASKGEFDLHSSYFISQKIINPQIKNQGKVIDILKMQIQILHAFRDIDTDDTFSPEYRQYIESVRKNLASDCARNLDELLLVLSSGRLEFSDAERIIRLEKLHQRTLNHYEFTLFFRREVSKLDSHKAFEINELKKMEVFYEK